MELGGKFWVGLIAVIVGVCIGGYLIFTLIAATWVKWGAFGALIIAFAAIFGITWVVDRMRIRRQASWIE